MGGLMDHAFKYVIANKGIDTESSYPYTAKDGKKCLFSNSTIGATITGFKDIPSGSEKDLQEAVATVGPVSVAIDASKPTFHFYKSGVYFDKRCSNTHLDHGVLAVGYGADENGEASSKYQNKSILCGVRMTIIRQMVFYPVVVIVRKRDIENTDGPLLLNSHAY